MRTANHRSSAGIRAMILGASFALVTGAAAQLEYDETDIRKEIAATNPLDALVIDCQLPGKLRKLGGTKTYLTPGQLTRTAAIDCYSRGGEYTVGNLASGTLSLNRWMVPADKGDAEAQYYVARIYANGMDNVPTDYRQAAHWYKKASDQGHSEAMQELGYLYEEGLGVEKDQLKALNLQRDASGLGEELDYAYKIADAEKLVVALTERLTAANGALRDSQSQAQQTEGNLAQARAEIQRLDLQTTALVAELKTARQTTGDPNSPAVRELEQQLENAKAGLEDSQATILSLEMERDSANAELGLQMLGAQATQLELRELLARTQTAESKSESLAVRFAESQQRLIESDHELLELQNVYREQSEHVATETARLQQARAHSDSDAAAYIVSQEAEIALGSARVVSLESEVKSLRDQLEKAGYDSVEVARRQSDLEQELHDLQVAYREQSEHLAAESARLEAARARSDSESETDIGVLEVAIASRSARMENLESEVASLRDQLETAEDDSIEVALRSELENLQIRFDQETQELQRNRKQLEANNAKSEQELGALYTESQQRLTTAADDLSGRRRQIDNLMAETDKLRTRVHELESERAQQAEESGVEISRLQAQLSMSREEAVSQRIQLEQLRADTLGLTARLAKNQMELHRQQATGKATNQDIELLHAQIEAGKSTINAQILHIAAREKSIGELEIEIDDLKAQLDVPEVLSTARRTAKAVLDLARSKQEPNLGSYHALLIANQNYENLPSLETPIKDAYEIKTLLETQYGFSVKVLKNATNGAILDALHGYSLELTPDDNLLIYYAGRGSTPEGPPPDRAYWLGIEAEEGRLKGRLGAENVSEKISQIQAKRVLVVTDSCFSKRRVRKNSLVVGRGLDPDRFKRLAKHTSRSVLTSGANLPIFDDENNRDHSLFAKYFLEVLRRNGNVLSGELLAFQMAQRIREDVEDPQRSTPAYNVLQGAGHKAGDFFFVPSLVPTMMADTSLDDNTG